MARILYWNVNNFTDVRINTSKRIRRDTDFDVASAGPGHLRMIMDTIGDTTDPNTGMPATLDFIVIVEIHGRNGVPTEGQLAGGNGLTGCLNLLNEFNNDLTGNWSLVPPVITGADGDRESIAVFYRRDLWYFLGPQTWPAAYPLALAGALPARPIPGPYPYRGGAMENRSAGQWSFPQTMPPGFMGPPPLVNFPSAWNRKPWLTAFGQVGNANNLLRIISLHTKPNGYFVNYADQGTANLANAYDITARPADALNQTDVLVGDFNVENLNAGNFLAPGPFARLIGVGMNPVAPAYTPLIRPPAMLNPNYVSYYHTHGHPPHPSFNIEGATIIDEDAMNYWAGEYPGREYSNGSIDNALVRYLGGAAPPANFHMSILARAHDVPYNAPGGPPPVMPMLGYYQNGIWMDESMDTIHAMAPDPNYDLNERFREFDNYGLIYSVSDHFALLFDV
jgi:hypothetical protein